MIRRVFVIGLIINIFSCGDLWPAEVRAETEDSIVIESVEANATANEVRAFFDILLPERDPNSAPLEKRLAKARDFMIVKHLSEKALEREIEKPNDLDRHRRFRLLESCADSLRRDSFFHLNVLDYTEKDVRTHYETNPDFWNPPRLYLVESLTIDKSSAEIRLQGDDLRKTLFEIRTRAQNAHSAALSGTPLAAVAKKYGHGGLDIFIPSAKIPDLLKPSFYMKQVPNPQIVTALREAKGPGILPLIETRESFQIIHLISDIPPSATKPWNELELDIRGHLLDSFKTSVRNEALDRVDRECIIQLTVDPAQLQIASDAIVFATISVSSVSWTYTYGDFRRDRKLIGLAPLVNEQEINRWKDTFFQHLREGVAGWLIGASTDAMTVKRAEIEFQRDLAAMEIQRMHHEFLEKIKEPDEREISAFYIENPTGFRLPEQVEVDLLVLHSPTSATGLAMARIALRHIEAIGAEATRNATETDGLAEAYKILTESTGSGKSLARLRDYLKSRDSSVNIHFINNWRVSRQDLFPYGIWNGPETVFSAPVKSLFRTPVPTFYWSSTEGAGDVGAAYWYIHSKMPESLPPLKTIHEQVAHEWKQRQATLRLQEEMARMTERLDIRIDQNALIQL